MCNLLLELFDMNERTNMLRRQAVQVILQDILGGTIERYDAGQPMALNTLRALNAHRAHRRSRAGQALDGERKLARERGEPSVVPGPL